MPRQHLTSRGFGYVRRRPLIDVAPRAGWREYAACVGADPELFDYEINDRGQDRWNRITMALSFCDSCPVRNQCLAEARQENYMGIWGGEYLAPRWARGRNIELERQIRRYQRDRLPDA